VGERIRRAASNAVLNEKSQRVSATSPSASRVLRWTIPWMDSFERADHAMYEAKRVPQPRGGGTTVLRRTEQR